MAKALKAGAAQKRCKARAAQLTRVIKTIEEAFTTSGRLATLSTEHLPPGLLVAFLMYVRFLTNDVTTSTSPRARRTVSQVQALVAHCSKSSQALD